MAIALRARNASRKEVNLVSRSLAYNAWHSRPMGSQDVVHPSFQRIPYTVANVYAKITESPNRVFLLKFENSQQSASKSLPGSLPRSAGFQLTSLHRQRSRDHGIYETLEDLGAERSCLELPGAHELGQQR
ncbi:hypothetical protein M413DRAFT_260510 [Hebeloma cylindrosporum]|uniref:Uncharacterized protein n=1 Tax=Hebeloma cylindrosporum TaxID=76867 RepID=A0A0C3CRG9_HEBCY|nr:hypothetical protein M413DRAFT_260510 [Hebeloma cylindrosporum h7]